jgi:hypothetical protein
MKVALALRRIGLNSSLMRSLGLGSIAAALSLWARSAAGRERVKGSAEGQGLV